MEASIIALMLLLVIGLMAWRLFQGQRTPDPTAVDELLGPLPEGDAQEAELTDSAESSRAAPRDMASAPTSAYGSRGNVGSSPSFVDETLARLSALDRLPDSAGTKLGLAAGAGAAVGLGLLIMSRRRARRRRRIERLRQQARRMGNVATVALLMARDRVSALPVVLPPDLDRRTSTGGGVALLATAALLAAIRSQHERRTRAAEAAEALRLAAEAAEAASRRGWRGFRGFRGWAATSMAVPSEVAVLAESRQFNRVPRWWPAISPVMVAAVLLAVRAVRRRREAGVAA
jgi:hypothetical protein